MAATRTSRAKNKNNMLYKDTRSGFTIIEVVLVLAIAGLIFLMVFIALPQLQRAQRDTQRREDVSKLRSAIELYKGNNNGRLPATSTCNVTVQGDGSTPLTAVGDGSSNVACRLIKEYMHGANDTLNLFVDPGGKPYNLVINSFDNLSSALGNIDFNNHNMYVVTGAVCDGEEVKKDANNPRNYAIVYRMEGSGVYCNS